MSIDDFEDDFDEDAEIEDDRYSDNSKSWYFINSVNGSYYTPFAKGKRVYSYIGEGKDHPSIKDTVEYLNSDGANEYEADGKFFSKYYSKYTNAKTIKLPSGIYTYAEDNHTLPERLLPTELRSDQSLNLKEDHIKNIEEDINQFIKSESLYKEHGFSYRLGILMWGPAGNSKTLTCRKIIKELIPKDSITIFLDNVLPTRSFITKIKHSLTNRLKVFIFEEMTSNADKKYLTRLLNFLDGEESVEHSIVIGSTNYPEDLPGNLIDRPSRFDKLYKFDNPSDKQRAELIHYFLNCEVDPKWIDATKGLSIAAIKEICLSILVGKFSNFDNAVKVLKDRSNLVRNNFKVYKGELGFGI